MATKPKKLPIVPIEPVGSGGPAPPRRLGVAGAALWHSVTAEYTIEDAGGVELLTLACQSLDRAEALREQIDADGEITRSKSGLKDHPGLKHELGARSFVART